MMAYCNSHITGYYHPPQRKRINMVLVTNQMCGSADLFRYGLSCFATESICTASGTLCVKSHYRPKRPAEPQQKKHCKVSQFMIG